jgi:hypothetical protein
MKPDPHLQEQEAALAPAAARRFVLLFLLGWLALTGIDWEQRFTRYGWHERWFTRHQPAPSNADRTPVNHFTTQTVAATRGGDLTTLIGVRSAQAPFQEEREAAQRVYDAYGFLNAPYDPQQTPDIVVVGDSFMASGHVDTHFSEQLAQQTGLFVYNRAMSGHGPLIPVYRFFDDPRFTDPPPRVLVWGFAEREIGGELFRRLPGRLPRTAAPADSTTAAASPTATGLRIHWHEAAPARLHTSLPDTSFLAQAGQWGWARIRYALLRQLHPWVVASDGDVIDGPMLFFRYHIETLGWTEAMRRPDEVADAIATLDRYCRERKIRLIVVLIPEKEQVYRDAIPAHLRPDGQPFPPSVLWQLETLLHDQGVEAVNLLRPFAAAREAGERLYWRDDTHWNDAGIRIAAGQVAALLKQ